MMHRLAVAGLAGLCLISMSLNEKAKAQVFSTKAEFAALIDVTSGTTLFEKNAYERMPPASMAKMMTLAVVFEALKNRELALHDKMTVSENAWRRGGANSGGSTMFAKLDSEISVEDLIKGIAVQSGNDACITLAEGISGTEQAFTQRMNALAKKIGMTDSNFTTSTGLPDENQYTTAHDLAILGRYLIEEFPDLYHFFALPEFTWNKIKQSNRNPLLKANIGADGIKTGFTKESGYGVVGSAKQDNRRLLVVVNGLKTRRERAEETKRMVQWGFRSFETVQIFERNEVIGNAAVFGGAQSRVNVVAQRPIAVLLPKGQYGRITAKVHYKGPLKAPVEAGVEIGELVVKVDGKTVQTSKVFTNEEIERGTLQQRALDAIYELTIGWFGSAIQG